MQSAGVNVLYTRTEDVYDLPIEKARIVNESNADYVVSIHRNSSPYPNQYTGVESLVYNRYSAAGEMAANINAQLEKIGFVNQGVNERKNLVILRRTRIPAVLVEVGFINTDADNYLFDTKFYETADAIARGILDTIQ